MNRPILSVLVGCSLIAIHAAKNETGDSSVGQNWRIPLGIIEPDLPAGTVLDPRIVELGRKLFFEKRLSKTDSVSCASCHIPDKAFASDSAAMNDAMGNLQRRNAQSVLNSGLLSIYDWDGKASTLEAQLDSVFTPWGDMGLDIAEAIARTENIPDYRLEFKAAFGDEVITSNRFRFALASYQRSLLSGDSRFDDFLFGGNLEALTVEERNGWELFIGKASCISCHDVFHPSVNSLGGGIAIFTDQRFHNLGIGYELGVMRDVGRFEVTRKREDWGAFRTPGLRNVALTSPYMHDGSLRSLDEVVELYNRGGNQNPNLSPGIRPLHLTSKEIRELVAFLHTLTDQNLFRANTGKVPK